VKIKILMVLITLTGSAVAQNVKHAPTTSQCKSDYALWNVDFTPQKLQTLSFYEMVGRSDQMQNCLGVFLGLNDSIWAGNVYSLWAGYQGQMRERMFDYLMRHNELMQFMHEDDAGQR
jgi:hypothetical protein